MTEFLMVILTWCLFVKFDTLDFAELFASQDNSEKAGCLMCEIEDKEEGYAEDTDEEYDENSDEEYDESSDGEYGESSDGEFDEDSEGEYEEYSDIDFDELDE